MAKLAGATLMEKGQASFSWCSACLTDPEPVRVVQHACRDPDSCVVSRNHSKMRTPSLVMEWPSLAGPEFLEDVSN